MNLFFTTDNNNLLSLLLDYLSPIDMINLLITSKHIYYFQHQILIKYKDYLVKIKYLIDLVEHLNSYHIQESISVIIPYKIWEIVFPNIERPSNYYKLPIINQCYIIHLYSHSKLQTYYYNHSMSDLIPRKYFFLDKIMTRPTLLNQLFRLFKYEAEMWCIFGYTLSKTKKYNLDPDSPNLHKQSMIPIKFSLEKDIHNLHKYVSYPVYVEEDFIQTSIDLHKIHQKIRSIGCSKNPVDLRKWLHFDV